jgi:exodeoxyribonuclease VII large subunit
MPAPTTWTVSGLSEVINSVLSDVFGGEIWVEGDITNMKRAQSGHVYFTLAEHQEPGERTAAPPSLSVTLFEWHRNNVNANIKRHGGNVRMSDGVRVRIRGTLEVYPARSQLQLRMTGIDPVFTLGSLAVERQRIITTLSAEGLLDANKALRLATMPLRIAVITSLASAAHADFMDEIRQSGYGFEVTELDARVQGVEAEDSLIAALAAAQTSAVDLIAIVRGGGAKTDLAVFDSERLARAVASSLVPVWSGLGHETDESITDLVAHQHFKTPTACAAAIIAAISRDHDRFENSWQAVTAAAESILSNSDRRLSAASTSVASRTAASLATADALLVGSADRLRRSAEFVVRARRNDLEAKLSLVEDRSRWVLQRQAERLATLAARATAHDPALALRRGWSITHTADGKLATAATAPAGAVLVTRFEDGVVRSVVDANSASSPNLVEAGE